MYDKDYGIINFLLNNAGILSHNIAYLQDVSVALPAAMVVNIWKGFPYVAIMLLAGTLGIDTSSLLAILSVAAGRHAECIYRSV